jgi:uncharacterized phage protein (TIGR02220 family)
MSGWIKLHREINSHWIWSNSDYFKWWIDILLEVNHTPAKVLIKGKVYNCGRGEKLYSLDTWASRWGTNKSKVKRFLEMLQKDEMICVKNETQTTRVTICKYDDYQENENKSETQVKRKRNASETQVKSIQERKERIEYKEEDSLAVSEKPQIDFDKLLLFFNTTTGKNVRVVNDKTKKQFNARLKEGYTKADIFNAIKNCYNDDYHQNNPKYLTLEFISRPDKLEKYSNYQKKVDVLPSDWFHRELSEGQKDLLDTKQLDMWKRNKNAIEMEGGRLYPIKLIKNK